MVSRESPNPPNSTPRTRERPTLVVYGRRDCHLCDVAKEVVEVVRARVAFDVEERDVDDDPAWAAAYGDQVPVAFLGDRKVFKYRVDAAALERVLRAASPPALPR